MSSPKIICKSGCIKSIEHFLNILEYSGNKIASQSLMFKDGSVLKVDADKKIKLSPAEALNVDSIYLEHKDGGGKSLTYEQYQKYAINTTQTITANELENIQDDSEFLSNGSPHEMKDLDFFKYLPYIEDRKGAEKSEDGHGLFGVNGDISIDEARATAMLYEDNRKWSHILSIADKGESTGFDKRENWKNLVASISPQIAKRYNISLENLIINAAFHSNTDNAHIHLCFYSTDSAEGFIKGGKSAMNEASNHLKSLFVNRIYKDEISALNKTGNNLRTGIAKQLDMSLNNLMGKDYSHTELADMLIDLSCDIDNIGGRGDYGYLPEASKNKVNDILKWIIGHDSDVNILFDAVMENHREYILNYEVDPAKVEREMNTFLADFYSPKKGRGLYQNLIVTAAKELNKPSAETLRTVEEKMVEFKPSDPALSSGYDEIYLPTDDDVPSPSDFDEPADFSAYDFGEPPSPVTLRTIEEKMVDFKPSAPALSSGKIAIDKEVNKSINKALFKCLNLSLNADGGYTSQYILGELKQMQSDGGREHSVNIIKMLYAADDSFKNILDDTTSDVFEHLKRKFGTEKAMSFITDYKDNLFSVENKLPMHSVVAFFAKNLDENLYSNMLKQNKEAFKNVNKSLSAYLRTNILNPDLGMEELSNSLISEEIDTAKVEQATAKIFKAFAQSDSFVGQLDELTEVLDKEIDNTFDDNNIALAFKSRLQSDFECGIGNIPYNFLIQSFAKDLQSNQAWYCFGQMKIELKEFRSNLFKAMRSAYVNTKAPNHFIIKSLFDNARDIRDLDSLLKTLSTGEINLLNQKQSLQNNFCSQMGKHFSTTDKTAKEMFDKFFFETDNEYNTLSVRRIIHSFVSDRHNILSQYQSYRMKYICGTLLQGIGRILHAQAQHQQQSNERNNQNNLRAKKQFENQKQFISPAIQNSHSEISY